MHCTNQHRQHGVWCPRCHFGDLLRGVFTSASDPATQAASKAATIRCRPFSFPVPFPVSGRILVLVPVIVLVLVRVLVPVPVLTPRTLNPHPPSPSK